MPAAPHFHASPQVFAPGDTLIPGASLGRSTFRHGEVTNRHVFTSRSLTDAQEWARLIGPLVDGDVFIYTVRPQGRARRTDSDEWRCSSATVVAPVAVIRQPAAYSPGCVRWTHDFDPHAALTGVAG